MILKILLKNRKTAFFISILEDGISDSSVKLSMKLEGKYDT